MFKEILQDLLSEKGINQKQLSISASIPPTTISGWLNADRLPDYNALIKLSNFFNVSTDYLLGRTDELGAVVMPSPAPQLTGEEKKLLDNFRTMRPDLQAYYLKMSETFVQTSDTIISTNQKKKA